MFPLATPGSRWRVLVTALAILLTAVLVLLVPGTRAGGAAPTAPTAPAPYGTGAPLTVFAASSLTEALQKVAAAWTAHGGGPVTFSFDASSRLARQIEAGAPAHVFVAADVTWAAYVAAHARVESQADLLGNTLVVAVRASSGASFIPTRPADLAAPGVERLALAGENVPAGAYARAALRATGTWDAVQDRVVSGDNVRTALGWVATGEADAGIVYRTDVRVEPRVREAFAFPASAHPPIVYRGVVLAGAGARDGAAFLVFCQGPEATAIFEAAGFGPPDAGAPVPAATGTP
ncbi:MAG: molybdate ABC transporter substrate-binding protein [Pseudomonadota bacterium]|nr:molybdate ABC transporter substrate-binding protein [Pseudomonadota bacterium]